MSVCECVWVYMYVTEILFHAVVRDLNIFRARVSDDVNISACEGAYVFQ